MKKKADSVVNAVLLLLVAGLLALCVASIVGAADDRRQPAKAGQAATHQRNNDTTGKQTE